NTFMQTTETLLRSDWKIYRGGAIYITGGEDIDVGNNTIYEVGTNGIFVDGYNLRVRLHDNEIHDLGFSAINFAGKENAVRNPLTF
ncbi:right-handed parallel beta-helix repeat-containing protein, partial [Stenotrophomonas sp. GbtcB23]|uniref:right-handed parallel beta-helix repeat-containing protein n=1 Tax=Stenotrophomonas sp. GbtcB23 TaxID=2824768 RepID=UPI001C2FF680